MNQIKHRITGAVLYEYDSGLSIRDALEKATQSGANLRGVDLGGADLGGANLGETLGKLTGERPFFQCGPIGSRSDYLLAFITDKGIAVKAGCFSGMLDEFRAAVEKTHGDTDHGKEYQMAMLMIEAHAAIWMPRENTK